MDLHGTELLLSHSAQALRQLLEFLSLISVAIGLVAVLSGARKLRLREIPPHLVQRGPVTMARVTFGSWVCLLYTSPSPRDKRQSRMPSSA